MPAIGILATADAMLDEAAKYEVLAKDMKRLGDHAAARAFEQRSIGCLEYAMELELRAMEPCHAV